MESIVFFGGQIPFNSQELTVRDVGTQMVRMKRFKMEIRIHIYFFDIWANGKLRMFGYVYGCVQKINRSKTRIRCKRNSRMNGVQSRNKVRKRVRIGINAEAIIYVPKKLINVRKKMDW